MKRLSTETPKAPQRPTGCRHPVGVLSGLHVLCLNVSGDGELPASNTSLCDLGVSLVLTKALSPPQCRMSLLDRPGEEQLSVNSGSQAPGSDLGWIRGPTLSAVCPWAGALPSLRLGALCAVRSGRRQRPALPGCREPQRRRPGGSRQRREDGGLCLNEGFEGAKVPSALPSRLPLPPQVSLLGLFTSPQFPGCFGLRSERLLMPPWLSVKRSGWDRHRSRL